MQAFQFASVGEDDQFVGYKSLAIQLRNRFQREIGKSTNRVGLPPFEELEKQALDDLFRPASPTFLLQFWNNFVLPLSYPKITAKTWSLMLFHPQFKDQWKVPPKIGSRPPYPPLPQLPYKTKLSG